MVYNTNMMWWFWKGGA